MTKDRLKDLYRGTNPFDEEEPATSTEDNGHVTIELSNVELEDVSEMQQQKQIEAEQFMHEFFHEVAEIRALIDRIEECEMAVRKLQSSILASPDQNPNNNAELEDLMTEIKICAHKVKTRLKSIKEANEKLAEDESRLATSADCRIRNTQHAAMSRRFINAMSNYNSSQVEFKEACKARIKRQMEIACREISDEELEEMLESGSAAVFTQGIMTDTQQARQTLADIEARHEDILKLEKSIRELHDMFLDMALLVENQGELLNSIEHNVQLTVDYVECAKKETKEAVVYQTKARKKKVCLIATAAIVAIVIVLVIVLSIVLSR